ncbi:MAG: ABC transporter substrate-binding protein, partial [Acidimicrobiales bacterium]|nr:ABC transporter substrate-binding protein [Acidimicrobiales bacterium]
MQRSFMRIVAMLFALALVAVACGSDASTDDSASAADTSSESTSSSEEAMDDERDDAVAASYGPAEDCSADEGGLNIGTLLPETGALAFLGDPLIQAVEMAICDINAAGGVNGQLVTRSAGDS